MKFNPFKEFGCGGCRVRLKTSLFVKLSWILTGLVIIASFFFTFPVLHEAVHSHPNWIINFIMRAVLPYVVIFFQVVVLVLPASLYTWSMGGVELISTGPRSR